MSRRKAGVLLPVASLPGPYGIGDLGPGARDFVAWLASAKQRVWQVLPLTVTDGTGCPYASPTAFAREPLLLSPDDLVEDGFASQADKPYLDPHRIDYPAVRARKAPFLKKAATAIAHDIDLDAFRDGHPWVDSWSLFAAIADRHGHDWTRWPAALRDRHDLDSVRMERKAEIDAHTALQWAFERQWMRLRRVAKEHGIALWGDLPFFVGLHSADVWAHRALFQLDPQGQPLTVSGVPPDDFSPTGQMWGHPQFKNTAHTAEAWAWWTSRIHASLELVDGLRLDHFRGMHEVWEVAADAESAEGGRWIPGPGAEALNTLRGLPIFAEDLGVITEEVEALRKDADLPGMAILQFAFGADANHEYLPHNHRVHRIVYTGTHDNDTLLGWFRSAPESARDHARRYLSCSDRDLVWSMLRAAWRSVAHTAIVPMQDLLSLGSEARLNIPGTIEGNWSWRLGREALNLSLAERVGAEATLSGRTS